jgi:SPP1 family predicted phage head-tail adaptor
VIERLNERITIQHNTVVADRYGNHRNEWTDHFICHAYASTYVKEENESSAVVNDERVIIFEVRYCSELRNITSNGYRILFHGEAYNIESVDMMNWQKRMIHLKCRKEKRS